MIISNAWTTPERYAVIRKIAGELEDWQRGIPPHIVEEYTGRLRLLASEDAQFLEAHRASILGDDWRDWTHVEPTS